MVWLFTTAFVVFYFSMVQSIWSVVCFAKTVEPCKKAWIWFTLSRTECWKYWENREGANAPTLFILNLITSNIYERWSCWKLKMQFRKNGFRIQRYWCRKQDDTPGREFHRGKIDLRILYFSQLLDEFFWYIAAVEAPFITLESFKIREYVITDKKLCVGLHNLKNVRADYPCKSWTPMLKYIYNYMVREIIFGSLNKRHLRSWQKGYHRPKRNRNPR